MANHPTVPARLGSRTIDIDEAIAPLLQAVWKHEIHTTGSCQGNPDGWVMIEFVSTTELARFLDAAAPPRKEIPSAHERAETVHRHWLGEVHRRWRYEVVVLDSVSPRCSLCRAMQAVSSFEEMITLRFPFEDLPEVRSNVEAFEPNSSAMWSDNGVGPYRMAVRKAAERCPRRSLNTLAASARRTFGLLARVERRTAGCCTERRGRPGPS